MKLNKGDSNFYVYDLFFIIIFYKFYAFPLLTKVEFLPYFTNLVPVPSVQKNGEKNSKKRLLFDLSGS